MGQPIDYPAVLADLRLKRTDIVEAIRRIERVMRAAPLAALEVAVPLGAWTAPQQILAVLERWPLKTFTTKQVAREISSLDAKTLRTTLARLAREGRIDKPARGYYRARKALLPALDKSPEATE